MKTLLHTEVMDLSASPDQVRSFITTPQRILDYYPHGIEAGELEAGKAIYCRGKQGISLLEVDQEQSNGDTIVMKVYTAQKCALPYTVEGIKSAAFFSMVERWQVEAHGQGSRLTKSWGDVTKYKLRFLPMNWMVKRGARGESAELVAGWNAAAR